MGGLKDLKIAIDANDFYREFRENVRDPIVKKLTGRGDDVAKQMVELLETELPKFLYETITKLERSGKNGMGKFVSAIMLLKEFLEKHNLGWLAPWLVPVLQRSVRMIYRKYFEAFFDNYGLEDTLEWLVGFELSSDDTTPVEPELFDDSELEPDTI